MVALSLTAGAVVTVASTKAAKMLWYRGIMAQLSHAVVGANAAGLAGGGAGSINL